MKDDFDPVTITESPAVSRIESKESAKTEVDVTEISSYYFEQFQWYQTEIIKIMSSETIQFVDVVILIQKAMEIVEYSTQAEDLDGQSKAKIAIKLIKDIVDYYHKLGRISDEAFTYVNFLASSSLGFQVIFTLISMASKGKIAINEYFERVAEVGCGPATASCFAGCKKNKSAKRQYRKTKNKTKKGEIAERRKLNQTISASPKRV